MVTVKNSGFQKVKQCLLNTSAFFMEDCTRIAVTAPALIIGWLFPKIGESRYRPQNTIVLIMGTPKKGSLTLGHSRVLHLKFDNAVAS